MNSYTLLQTFLALHLTGLVLMAGTIVVDSMIYRAFWQQYNTDREQSVNLLAVSGKFGRVTGIGAALLILTGIGMMAVTQGVFGEQLWFRVKFVLVILLIVINLLARRRGLRLRKAIAPADSQPSAIVTGARSFLDRYFIAAFAIILIIILLSVFKFN